jgi:hypothetical protein
LKNLRAEWYSARAVAAAAQAAILPYRPAPNRKLETAIPPKNSSS